MWLSEELDKVPSWVGVLVLGVLAGLFVNYTPNMVQNIQDELSISAQISLATIIIAALAFIWISYRIYIIEQKIIKELSITKIAVYEILYIFLISYDSLSNSLPDGGEPPELEENSGKNRHKFTENIGIIAVAAVIGSTVLLIAGTVFFGTVAGTPSGVLMSVIGGVAAGLFAKYVSDTMKESLIEKEQKQIQVEDEILQLMGRNLEDVRDNEGEITEDELEMLVRYKREELHHLREQDKENNDE